MCEICDVVRHQSRVAKKTDGHMSLELRKKTWVEWTRYRQNFLTSYFEIISDLQKVGKIIYKVPVYTSPNVNICVTRVDL